MSSLSVERHEDYNGYRVEVCYDPDPESPREWDTVGAFRVGRRNDYFRGDEYGDLDDIRDDPDMHWLLVYGYAHGGCTVSTAPFGDRWDSGLVGVIYVSKADWQKEESSLSAEEILKSEIETLAMYLEGRVFGYQILDKDGDVVESCWGSYCTPAEVLQEAKSMVDHLVRQNWKKMAESAPVEWR